MLLAAVAVRVGRRHGARLIIGVDGRSGAGKSTFAEELRRTLGRRGRSVICSTTNLFHQSRQERMRLGGPSLDGSYQDSHKVSVIIDELLVPFHSGAAKVLIGAFDEPSDLPQPLRAVGPEKAILIFDGLFVHRPEFHELWGLSVMLRADRRCGEAWLRYLETDLPIDPTDRAAKLDQRLDRARWPRYRHGWQRYLDAIGRTPATVHIDNEDVSARTINKDKTAAG